MDLLPTLFEWHNISGYSCILRYWNSNASFLDSYFDVHGDVCCRSNNKRDLSGVGRAGQAALIGVIIALVLNIFILRSSVVELFISLLLVVIFAGITAYDNQSIRNIYVQTNGTAHSGIAVFMALKLYLDFINLFLAFLRIFGRNN